MMMVVSCFILIVMFWFLAKLLAIHQLEACLGATFSSLPHTHGNVPQVLKALCETARFYSTGFIEDAEHRMGKTDNRLMTLAAILPCARLSCARNGHVMLIARHHVTQNIPEDILSIVSVSTWLHSINLEGVLPIVSEENDFNSEHGEIAPFLFVKNAKEKDPNQSFPSSTGGKHSRRRQTRRSSSHLLMDGKQGTIVDLEPVASTIKHVLQVASACQSSSPSSSSEYDDEEDYDRTLSLTSIRHIPSILCTISYTVLSLFWSRGMAFPGVDDKTWLDITPSTTCEHNDHDDNELISRSQAVSDFAGVLGHIIVSRIGSEENNLQLGRRVCKVLVEQSKSQIQKVVQQACCGLISLLSSLRHSFGKRASSMERDSRDVFDDAITGYLVEFIEYVCSVLQGESASSDFLLIPLIDGTYIVCLFPYVR